MKIIGLFLISVCVSSAVNSQTAVFKIGKQDVDVVGLWHANPLHTSRYVEAYFFEFTEDFQVIEHRNESAKSTVLTTNQHGIYAVSRDTLEILKVKNTEKFSISQQAEPRPNRFVVRREGGFLFLTGIDMDQGRNAMFKLVESEDQ